ncbi:Uncharacterised protein [Acinetobacter ursingii]|nr:Uncharacterised protein [Acinetobacter ursingii]
MRLFFLNVLIQPDFPEPVIATVGTLDLLFY